ncbi:MAG: hypothetical protein J5758_01730, partial [Abditibacteriota bacterium]|nr:hypothetical protein [Abditibacteriota bacterium]
MKKAKRLKKIEKRLARLYDKLGDIDARLKDILSLMDGGECTCHGCYDEDDYDYDDDEIIPDDDDDELMDDIDDDEEYEDEDDGEESDEEDAGEDEEDE